jgi:hypothetical protein
MRDQHAEHEYCVNYLFLAYVLGTTSDYPNANANPTPTPNPNLLLLLLLLLLAA